MGSIFYPGLFLASGSVNIIQLTVVPDNPNRERRVRQLIDQTSTIQSQFINIENGIVKTNDDAYKLLADLARFAGYPTVEEYCQAGIHALPDSQREAYGNLTNNLLKYNPAMKWSIMISGAVASMGVTINIGSMKFNHLNIPRWSSVSDRMAAKLLTGIVCKFSAFVRGMQGVLRGLILMIKGKGAR